MKYFSCKNAVLFFLVCIITLSLNDRALAFSAACDSCLASCSGLPSCCTGSGCLCQDECSSGNCGPCQQEDWYCTLYGDCWVIGCEPVAGPAAPTPTTPVDSTTGVSTSPALTWSRVSGAISYDTRICTNSTCSSLVASSNVSVSQWQVSPALNPSTTYWWQVRANNSCASGSWSTARKFTTVCLASPTDTPATESPANNSTAILSNTTLNWNDVACTATYDVRICSNSTCSSTVRTPAPTSASQWQITPALSPSTTYWWQVRANNAYGSGSWSTVSKFTTSSDVYLSNGSAWNDSITAISTQRTWKYYFIDLQSGSNSLVIDLYNLAKDADLYVRRGSKPTGSILYDCRPYKSGTTSEECTLNTPLSGTWWIGVNNWDTGTFSYTVKASWIAPPCTYTLTPTNYGFSAESNTGMIEVSASANDCSWTAASGYPWLTITSGGSGTGNGTVTYSVAANTTGGAQTGTMTVAGQTITIHQAKSTFTDDPANVYTPYINAIYSQGITVGCGGGNYCPSADVSRGQMAAFIIRSVYGGETFSYTTTPYYSDVPTTNDYFKYVQKMKDDGNTTVTVTYDVNGIVTRGQMAAFIIRAKYGENFTYLATPYFSDVPADHTFFKYVQKMKASGYTAVTGTYDVNGIVTRDQMAAFLGRAFLGMQ